MFGRATITLGIAPHSSVNLVTKVALGMTNINQNAIAHEGFHRFF